MGVEEKMGIKDLDRNFEFENVDEASDLVFYRPTEPPFGLYGVFYDEKAQCFLRMPQAVAERVSAGVNTLNRCTAGGRLRFSTDSAKFTIRVQWSCFGRLPHMPLSGSSGFTLAEETADGVKFIAECMPDWCDENGFERSVALPGNEMRNYILYFPLYNEVTDLKLGLMRNARVGEGKKYKQVAPILYYGSSITQGGCASRPDNSYQALISKWNGIDFINLGFSGNARAETPMVDYLSSVESSLIVVDYDHNAYSAEYLRQTHYRMYEQLRKACPVKPILFISKPDFERDAEAEERLHIICETYRRAKTAGDDKVYMIDGRQLFGKEDRENCTVDGTHPNDLGFYRMAQAIGGEIGEILKGNKNGK